MRCAALEALLELYGCRENLSAMQQFTERFKARFLELIYDLDDNVAILGVCHHDFCLQY